MGVRVLRSFVFWFVAVLVLLLLAFHFGVAQAADGATVVSLGPIVEWAGSLILTALGALASAALGALWRWLRLRADSEIRAYLEGIIQRGIGFAQHEVALAGERLTIDTHNQVLAAAAGYVVASAPDALRYFGIDELRVQQMISARLPPPGAGPPA